MNQVPFGESACEKTRRYLDSYISNELLVETNHDVLSHLEDCSACSTEFNARVQLRARLKSAVKSQGVAPGLEARIREQIRTRSAGSWFDGWTHWAVVLAAGLAVCFGVWLNYSRERMPALADRPAQAAYIQKVSANLAAVLRVGLGDHIHCSVFRKYPKNPPPVEQMEDKLGPSYRGLLPLVHAAVTDGYRLIMAHQCGYAGRKYIHLTLERNGDLLSLVVARKNDGESLDGLRAAAQSSGISIYQSAAGRYQVAGFEAGNFLAYVVSDLENQANLRIAASLAPGVSAFLIKTA